MTTETNLSDIVVVYNTEQYWKMIKLNILLAHNFGLYYDNDITICVCKKTYFACMLDGIYTYKRYDGDYLILEHNKKEYNIIKELQQNIPHKKYEVFICDV